MRGNLKVATAAAGLVVAAVGAVVIPTANAAVAASASGAVLAYTGTWDGSPASAEYWTDTAGATAKASVTVAAGGGTVSFSGDIGTASGIVTVKVDSAAATTVDLYRATLSHNAKWYTSPTLAAGKHSVTVTVTGTKRAASSGAWVDVMGVSTTNGSFSVPEPTGWKLSLNEDFTGTDLVDDKWYRYDGVSSSGSDSPFRPDHVTVADGALDIDNFVDGSYGWAGGGLATREHLTYGKYEVRLRMDPAQGVGLAILLWPSGSDLWPPEIDFTEHNGVVPRALNIATLHCGTPENHLMYEKSVATDLSQWHTWGVEWTPGKLVYTVDGRVWATLTNTCVPAIPMELGLQTEVWRTSNGHSQVPDATTPAHSHLQVDWVRTYVRS